MRPPAPPPTPPSSTSSPPTPPSRVASPCRPSPPPASSPSSSTSTVSPRTSTSTAPSTGPPSSTPPSSSNASTTPPSAAIRRCCAASTAQGEVQSTAEGRGAAATSHTLCAPGRASCDRCGRRYRCRRPQLGQPLSSWVHLPSHTIPRLLLNLILHMLCSVFPLTSPLGARSQLLSASLPASSAARISTTCEVCGVDGSLPGRGGEWRG